MYSVPQVEQHALAAMLALDEQRQQVAQQMAAQSKLVQSAETTAATAAAMYSVPPQPLPNGYSTPMAMAPQVVPTTVSYTPMPVNAAHTTVSYTPAPATIMQSMSYTPAPMTQTVSV